MLASVPHDARPLDPESRQFPPSCLPGIETTYGNSKMALWLVGDEAMDYIACYGVLREYTTAETAPAVQEISFLI